MSCNIFVRDGSFVQGRAFGKEMNKYITIKFQEDKFRYGLMGDLNKMLRLLKVLIVYF